MIFGKMGHCFKLQPCWTMNYVSNTRKETREAQPISMVCSLVSHYYSWHMDPQPWTYGEIFQNCPRVLLDFYEYLKWHIPLLERCIFPKLFNQLASGSMTDWMVPLIFYLGRLRLLSCWKRMISKISWKMQWHHR